MTASKIIEESMKEYFAGNYEGTLEYLKNSYDENFPNSLIDNIQFGVLAKLGRVEEALEVLERAIQVHGFWYSPTILENDADLNNIRDTEKFKTLLAICKYRHENHRYATPFMEIHPSNSDELFMMLHGNEQALEDLRARFNQDTMPGQFIVFPRASEQVMSDQFIWNDFERSEQELIKHYQYLLDTYPLDPDKTIAGAFSAGGTVLLENIINGSMKVKRLILIEPWLPRFDQIKDRLGVLKDLDIRIYLISGDVNVRLFETAKTLAYYLSLASVTFEFKIYEGMPHQIPDDIAEIFPAIKQFLFAE